MSREARDISVSSGQMPRLFPIVSAVVRVCVRYVDAYPTVVDDAYMCVFKWSSVNFDIVYGRKRLRLETTTPIVRVIVYRTYGGRSEVS